jgi:hypothetical protein
MSWRLSCRSGWATEREGLRLANPGAIVLLGLLGEAGSPVTVVLLPARRRPPQAADRRAGLEVVEKLLTSISWLGKQTSQRVRHSGNDRPATSP